MMISKPLGSPSSIMIRLNKYFILLFAALIAFLTTPSLLQDGLPSKCHASTLSSNGNEKTNQQLDNLVKELDSSDAYARQRAAISLGNTGDPRAIEPLIKALDDKEKFVRSFAAKALGSFDDPQAVDPLIESLDDESFLVRRTAAASLGILRDPRAIDPLIKALGDESFLVRRSVTTALGMIGDPRVVEPLIKLLGEDDSYIRNGAALALVNIGEAGKLAEALGDWILGPRIADILESLKWQPSSDEDKIRFEIARRDKKALLENWQITKKVLLADANSDDSRLVENAVYAFIGIGRDEVLEDLVRILDTKGNVEMAEKFLNCGNAVLSDAARDWLQEHGSRIEATAVSSDIEWGKMGAMGGVAKIS